MNKIEAAALVATLVSGFPGVNFGAANAAVYESGIIALDAKETQAAIESLIHSSFRLPTVAEIRAEVFRARKLARDLSPKPLQLTDGDGNRIGPSPAAWGSCLACLLESSARHQAMAEAWYASKGKKPPPDPAQALIDLAQAGARGEDVRARFRHSVVPSVEEQDEIERRFP